MTAHTDTDRSEPAPPRADGPEREQADVIAFLEDPRTHGGARPVRIDTHLSRIFLTDEDVYKLKRARRFDFVDYSTPERRRDYCQREIEANAAWAGSLYHGVRAVRRSDAGLRLDEGEGEPVDWIVHMRRFPDDARLDRRLDAGHVAASELIRFADDLARLHTLASPNISFGGAAATVDLIRQVAGGLESAQARPAPVSAIGAWRQGLEDEAEAASAALDARRRAGKIRRCHGDLHLRNIVFWQDRLIGFDALEFDDAMRTIDVLYDLAFPVMDFAHAGRQDAANLVLNRYLGRTGDYGGLAVFDLYLSLRAGVRALAAALSGEAEAASAYFETAQRFRARRATPRLIAIGGRSGSGKSTIAALLAPSLGPPPGAIVLRSDVLRKAIEGVDPEQSLDVMAYGPARSADVYERMRRTAASVAAAGYDCILDATFLDAAERLSLDRLAERLDVAALKLWLDAPAACLRARIAGRGEDASDADQAVLDEQLKREAPGDWRRVDASGDIASTRRAALDAALEPRPGAFIPKTPNPAHDV